MNDEPPAPFDTVGDEHVEARIVAWVLGEASAFEAAELERLCDERPELLVFRRRIETLHGLLGEAEAAESDHSWKLTPTKRQSIEEKFGLESTVLLESGKEQRIRRSGRRAILAIAACLVLTAVVGGLMAPGAGMKKRIDVRGGSAFAITRTPEAEMAAIDQAVRNQEEKVEEGKKTLTEVIRSRRIDYRGRDSFYDGNEEMKDRDARNTVANLQREKLDLETKVNSLLKYDVDQLVVTPGLNLPETLTNHYYPRYLEAKRDLTNLKIEGRGDRHSSVVAKQQELNAAERQLNEGLVDLRATWQAKLELANSHLKAMQGMKDQTHEEAIKRGIEAQDYTEAKRNFEADQELLATLKQKQAGQRMKHTTPASSVATPAIETKDRQLAFSNAESQPAIAAGVPAKKTESAVAGKASMDGADAFAPQQPATPTAALPRPRTAGGVPAAEPAVSAPGEQEDAMARVGRDRSGLFDLADAESPASLPPRPALAPAPLPESAKPVDGPAIAGDRLQSQISDDGSPPELAAAERGVNQPINRNNIDATLNHPSQLSEVETGKDLSAVSETTPPPVLGKNVAGRPVGSSTLKSKSGGESDDIGHGLYLAEGNFNLGRYDEAKREYENVLRTDPDNTAARRGLQQAATAKSDYYRAAYDHTRAEMLSQVDAAWELPVPMGETEPPLAKNPAGAESRFRLQEPSAARSDLFGTDYLDAAGGETGVAGDKFSLGSTSEHLFRGKDLSDAKANFDIIRESNYPTEQAPPAERASSSASALAFPVTPATPASFADQGDGEERPSVVDLAHTMDEVAAAENPYSTFSLNISDASFQVAKAALEKGERPDPEAIKVEQFYNAVDYGDPAPGAGEPVAAAIEQAAHPLIPGRNLVRVALRTASSGRSAAQSLRLTLLVDQSGSMVREDRRTAMEQAVRQLGGLLTARDKITVIGFSRTPRLLADGLPGDQGGKLDGLINQTASEGGTNLEEAMKLGARLAERHQLAGAQNRIVLFTDGAANLGNADPVKLAHQVKALRQSGIAFDIAGIGADGLNDRLLGELARHGNGRYYVVGDAKDESFARQLAGAFRPAAENVKVQVNFNPQRVGRYKLIGFEKDRLRTEDFRNDAVDAAELAADEAGVAIYQVEPLAGGVGEIGEVSVRFRDMASGEMVERAWTIPNQAAPAFDRATPSMQLAGLSMLAGEKLRGGPLADATDFKLLADPQARVRQFYGSSPRVAGMLQVIDALK